MRALRKRERAIRDTTERKSFSAPHERAAGLRLRGRTVLHFADAQITFDVGPRDDDEDAKKQQQDVKQALA
jgi:hypothetical protein